MFNNSYTKGEMVIWKRDAYALGLNNIKIL